MPKISLANGGEVLVDEADIGKVIGYRWLRNRHGYAVAYIHTDSGKQAILMHRMLTGAKLGQIVDHANQNRLDNRAGNLRICSHAENMRNRKRHKNNRLGVKGVYAQTDWGVTRFRAQIRVDGKKICIGTFESLEDAKLAYAEAAKKYHGAFAHA